MGRKSVATRTLPVKGLMEGKLSRIAFDLETLRMKAEKESFPQYKMSAGVSVLCAIDLDTNQPWFFCDEDIGEFSLEHFAQLCRNSKLLVSYNGNNFDIPVLQTSTERLITVMNHVDLLACIWRAIASFRSRYGKGDWTLDRVCKDTLGERKLLTDGAYAPQKWAEGRIGEVSTYCYMDTYLTSMLYKFIVKNGYVLDPFGKEIEIHLDPC